jgi:ribonuclease Z
MKVIFLGVGEACDDRLPNTSVLVESLSGGEKRSVLLDCGFTAPPAYWRQMTDQEELDALWVSHFHGDHFFGVPALLLRFWEMDRKKTLAILGQTGIEELVRKAMDLAYSGFMQKLAYELKFTEVESNGSADAAGLVWRFAENGHSRKDLAVRIEDGKKSIFYSGDGMPTEETLALARGCDLIIHEAFRLEGNTPGHGTIRACIDFARKAGAGSLALVHVQREERLNRYEEILEVIENTEELHVFLPEPDDQIEL